jgi:hypothetical protein
LKTDEQIIEELRKASEGLLFMSEIDHPFEIVRLGEEPELNEQLLREFAKASADDPVEQRGVDEFFRPAVSEPDWKTTEELALARRYQSLLRLLKDNLKEVRVYTVGKINMPVFILGKSAEGNWLGLKTRIVET